MLKVWTDGAEAALLDRFSARGSSFVYQPGALSARAVSVTMPVRLPSWDIPYGLAPIFEMNLPEGALRERLRLTFAKATGTFDDFDLLGIVGRSQVGRIRYTGEREGLQEDVPFQSVDEILEARRAAEICFGTCLISSRPSPASAVFNPRSWSAMRRLPLRSENMTFHFRKATAAQPTS
jgi:serine/threonine-protein kinase HipA